MGDVFTKKEILVVQESSEEFANVRERSYAVNQKEDTMTNE